MAPGAAPIDDALQTLINAGDSKDYITNFMISMLFIAGANSGVISGSMLNIVAHHPDWQEKIYQEIKASASKYAKNQNASLVDQLDSLPLEGWEKMSASIDLCYTEAIRMWVAFPMGRFNDTSNAIPIPGTDEVIPPGSFACYNTGDVHYSEKLYPNPMKWEPERWLEVREEFKQEAYGCE
jgi:sterol 14-demethylase